jgi:hypothetical protein
MAIQVISRTLEEEETRVPGKNYRPVASHLQTLSHSVVSRTLRLERGHVYFSDYKNMFMPVAVIPKALSFPAYY